MKKILLLLLCFVLLLSGCEKFEKAEAFYPETNEDIILKTKYNYLFEDESNILCVWTNNTGRDFTTHSVFELHVLEDGEWLKVTKGEPVAFNTNFLYGIDSEGESNQRYEVSVYTDKLKDGKEYRISTYCFDDDGNYYQVYAEFTCDNELAEKEIQEVTGGSASDRTDPEYAGELEIIEGNG